MLDLKSLYIETEKCLRCGRCTIVCPTYQVTKRESMVARGRVRLFREYVEGNIDLSKRFKLYNDLCLGCQACLEVCPPRVRVADLVRTVKLEEVRKNGLPMLYSLMLRRLLCNPRHFRRAVVKAGFLRKVPLPSYWQWWKKMLPAIPPRSFWELYNRPDSSSQTSSGPRVGYFIGCLTNALFPEVALSAIKVLERFGCQVVVPQVDCCGMPHFNIGDWESGSKFAKHNIEVFRKENVDYIVTDCSSCGYILKNYNRYLGNVNASEGTSVDEFCHKCYDINEFLIDVIKLKPGDRQLGVTVTYHDPCHLLRGQNIYHQPREILKSIAGVQYKEMDEAGWCCGAAGLFVVKHREIARKILQRKMEKIKSAGVQVVATACPMCLLQLDFGRREFGLEVEVVHSISLVARTLNVENGG